MGVPEVRAALQAIADREDCPAEIGREIRAQIPKLWRQRAVRRARRTAVTVTEATCEGVRACARANPGMSMRDIGRRFNIDQGRVSEILNGLR